MFTFLRCCFWEIQRRHFAFTNTRFYYGHSDNIRIIKQYGLELGAEFRVILQLWYTQSTRWKLTNFYVMIMQSFFLFLIQPHKRSQKTFLKTFSNEQNTQWMKSTANRLLVIYSNTEINTYSWCNLLHWNIFYPDIAFGNYDNWRKILFIAIEFLLKLSKKTHQTTYFIIKNNNLFRCSSWHYN